VKIRFLKEKTFKIQKIRDLLRINTRVGGVEGLTEGYLTQMISVSVLYITRGYLIAELKMLPYCLLLVSRVEVQTKF
jgi:hypothetical protein